MYVYTVPNLHIQIRYENGVKNLKLGISHENLNFSETALFMKSDDRGFEYLIGFCSVQIHLAVVEIRALKFSEKLHFFCQMSM